MEDWKLVIGYEDQYLVSDLGNVKSIKRDKLMRPAPDGDGYLMLTLCKHGTRKMFKMHRIVLEAFKGNRPNGFTASHLNGINTDNSLGNLKWDSHKDNCCRKKEHGTMNPPLGEICGSAKLKEFEVLNIRSIYSRGIASQRDLARRFNVTSSNIRKIITRKTWNHI